MIDGKQSGNEKAMHGHQKGAVSSEISPGDLTFRYDMSDLRFPLQNGRGGKTEFGGDGGGLSAISSVNITLIPPLHSLLALAEMATISSDYSQESVRN